MRTDAPKNNRKKNIRERCSEKSQKKNYKRTTDAPQKARTKNYIRTGAPKKKTSGNGTNIQ